MLYLVAVAQERSFTRAAKKLSVSQSALSQTIRNLEDRVGVRPVGCQFRQCEAGHVRQPAVDDHSQVEAGLVVIGQPNDEIFQTVKRTGFCLVNEGTVNCVARHEWSLSDRCGEALFQHVR